MFNATNARQTVAAAIELDSDLFAAELEDRFKSMTLSEQQALMRQLREVVSDQASAAAFAAGSYNQDQTGKQPAAIGAGTNGTGQHPTTEQEALTVLLNSGGLTNGIKLALRRLLYPQDPDHIKVGADGTPEVVGQLRQEVASKEADLRQERDPNHRGSLA